MKNAWKDMTKDQKIDFVKAGIMSGKSARDISAMVAGASRNAIIGFCHRNQLSLGSIPVASSGSPAEHPVPKEKKMFTSPTETRRKTRGPGRKPSAPIAVPANPPAPRAQAKEVHVEKVEETVESTEVWFEPNILQLTPRSCRWPTVETYRGKHPEEMKFCGRETGLASFCTFHHKIAYTPV